MTLRSIYESTANVYSRPFNPDQCAAFERSLSRFPVSIVSAAMDEWQSNTAQDYDGRALGAKMPAAADIAAICLRLNAKQAAVRRGEFVSCGHCREGWIIGRNTQGDIAASRCKCWDTYLATLPAPAPSPIRRARSGMRPASAMLEQEVRAQA